MCRTLAAIPLACLLIGCAGKQDDDASAARKSRDAELKKLAESIANEGRDFKPPGDVVHFRVAASELVAEFQRDKKAASAKYKGRGGPVVEMTGEVELPGPDDDFGAQVIVRGSGRAPEENDCLILCSFSAAGPSRETIRLLSRGQKIVLRGWAGLPTEQFIHLMDAIIVSTGPSGSRHREVAAIRAAFQAKDETMLEDLARNSVETTAQIIATGEDNGDVFWMLEQKKNDQTFRIRAFPTRGGRVALERAKAVKVGETIKVVGVVETNETDIILSKCQWFREVAASVFIP